MRKLAVIGSILVVLVLAGGYVGVQIARAPLVFTFTLKPYEESGALKEENVVAVTEGRLRALGIDRGEVSTRGNRLLVRLPADLAPRRDEIRTVLESRGAVSFHLASDAALQSPAGIARVESAWSDYRSGKSKKRPERRIGLVGRKNTKRVLENRSGAAVAGTLIDSATMLHDDRGQPSVAFELNPLGTRGMQILTTEHTGRSMAIVLDDRIVTEAPIMSTIGARGQLTGSFSEDEARTIAAILSGGTLEASLELEDLQVPLLAPRK